MSNPRLWYAGGIAGAVSVCCYIIAIAVDWPETQLGLSASLVIASAFPILGIISSYALYNFIAAERETAASSLGFVFFAAAFAMLLAMLIVQMAVVTGLGEITQGMDPQAARVLKRALRLIDLGLDVAWDLLGGTALILWGLALRKRSGFGSGWAIPCMVFGIALIVLNAATFPIPPANHGLFDVGPVVGLFMLALNVRLALLGRRAASGLQAAYSGRTRTV